MSYKERSVSPASDNAGRKSAVEPLVRCCCPVPDAVDCYCERYDQERDEALAHGEQCECGCHCEDEYPLDEDDSCHHGISFNEPCAACAIEGKDDLYF